MPSPEQEDASKGQKASETEQNRTETVPENSWMIRPCDVYYDEYSECTSIKGRFHQYFIFGETLNCNQWKKDYDNCCKWEKHKDFKAAESLIASEEDRRLKRLQGHYGNTVWRKRKAPPEDWDKPLPEWIQKRDENSYLALRAKELKEGKSAEPEKSSCVVM